MAARETPIHIKIPKDKKEAFGRLAASKGMSVSGLIRMMIYKELEEKQAA